MLLPSTTPDPRRGARARTRPPTSPHSTDGLDPKLHAAIYGTAAVTAPTPPRRRGRTVFETYVNGLRASATPPPSPDEAHVAALHGRLDRVEAALRRGGLTPKTTVGLQREMQSIAADLRGRQKRARDEAALNWSMNHASGRRSPEEDPEAEETASMNPFQGIRDNPHRNESAGQTVGRWVENARQTPARLGQSADGAMRKVGLDPKDHPYLATAAHFGAGALGGPMGLLGSIGKGLEDPAGAWQHAPEGIADLTDSVNVLGPYAYPSLYAPEERSGPAQLGRLLNLGAAGYGGVKGLDAWRGSALKAGMDGGLESLRKARAETAARARPGSPNPSSAVSRNATGSVIRNANPSEPTHALNQASSPSVLERATKAALDANYETARPRLEQAAKGLDLSGSRQEQALALRDAVDPSIRTHVGRFLKERWDRDFAEQKAQLPKKKKNRTLRGQEKWATDASASDFARRSRTVGADGTMLNEVYDLGRVSNPLATRIASEAGVHGMDGAMITLRADEVRHAFKKHGRRSDGAYAITHNDFDRLHAMLHDPSTQIKRAPNDDGNGNPVLMFTGRDARGQLYTNTAVLYPGRGRQEARLSLHTIGRKGLGGE